MLSVILCLKLVILAAVTKKPLSLSLDFNMVQNFTAIDFELATADYNSVCAVGVVTVEQGAIVNEFFSLVQPPRNKYMWQTSRVHGIKSKHTAESPTFHDLFSELAPLLHGQHMVAHNELFDRQVLQKTMQLYDLSYRDLAIGDVWECTSQIYRKIGFPRTKLNVCCEIMDIPLNHHDPLSDARASALLYLKKDLAQQKVKELQTEE